MADAALIGAALTVFSTACGAIGWVYKDTKKEKEQERGRAADRENYIIEQAEKRENLLMEHIQKSDEHIEESDRVLSNIAASVGRISTDMEHVKNDIQELKQQKEDVKDANTE